jgi:hypothetical protein
MRPPQHPRLRPAEDGPFTDPGQHQQHHRSALATPTLVAVAPTIAGMAKPASSPQVVATTHRRCLGSSLAETLVTIRPAPFDLIEVARQGG